MTNNGLQQFVSQPLVACVRVQVRDCTGSYSSEAVMSKTYKYTIHIVNVKYTVLLIPAPIAITATSPVKVGQDGIQIAVTRNANFATQTLQVTITPNVGEPEIVLSVDLFTVTITGLQGDIVYNFTIQALDGSNTPIGIPITGSYTLQTSTGRF